MKKCYRLSVLFVLSIVTVAFAITSVNAKTVLTIVGHWATVPAAEFMEMASEYTKLNPHIELQFIHAATGKYESIPKLLLMMGNEETNPDIINMYTAVAPEAIAGGIFAPVPPEMTQAAQRFFVPQLLQGLTFHGELYGIPSQNQTYAFGYNERIFMECGIAKPPTNWDELGDYARKLARVDGDGKVQRNGFAFGGNVAEFVHEFINLVWNNGGEYIDSNGKIHLNTLPVSGTIEFLADMVSRQIAAPVAPIGLGNGSIAMTLLANYRKQNLVKQPDYEHIRTVTVPTNKGVSSSAYQYGWGLHVSKQSSHPEEAWLFLQWLTMERSSAGSTRMGSYMANLGSLPTNMTDLNAHIDYKEPFYEGFMASLNTAWTEPLFPLITERQQEIQDRVLPVIKGTKPLAGMLEQLNKSLEALRLGLK